MKPKEITTDDLDEENFRRNEIRNTIISLYLTAVGYKPDYTLHRARLLFNLK